MNEVGVGGCYFRFKIPAGPWMSVGMETVCSWNKNEHSESFLLRAATPIHKFQEAPSKCSTCGQSILKK